MLSNFRWYRRWRGGKWAKVTGWLWGKRWVYCPQSVEQVDENYNAPCGHPAKHLKYDKPTRTIRCELCPPFRPFDQVIEIDEHGNVHPPEAAEMLRGIRALRR